MLAKIMLILTPFTFSQIMPVLREHSLVSPTPVNMLFESYSHGLNMNTLEIFIQSLHSAGDISFVEGNSSSNFLSSGQEDLPTAISIKALPWFPRKQ